MSGGSNGLRGHFHQKEWKRVRQGFHFHFARSQRKKSKFIRHLSTPLLTTAGRPYSVCKKMVATYFIFCPCASPFLFLSHHSHMYGIIMVASTGKSKLKCIVMEVIQLLSKACTIYHFTMYAFVIIIIGTIRNPVQVWQFWCRLQACPDELFWLTKCW